MPASSSTTQDFVPIRDIQDNVVLLKNGQLCMILLASSVNFALKSIDEQEAILAQFQNFLNTIDFTLQIYVKSRRLDIEPYIGYLTSLEEKQDNDLMRNQLRGYIDFIRRFGEDNDVMSKNFFVVVPYTPSKINLTKNITNLLSPKAPTAAVPNANNFEEHRIQLEQRTGIVTAGLARLGIRTITLQKDDLVEFYYHTYNPADITGSAPNIDPSAQNI